MKELRLTDKDGNDFVLAYIKVDGEDFSLKLDIPLILYLGSISLIDDEETRKRKEEEDAR